MVITPLPSMHVIAELMLTAGGACGHQKGNSNSVFVQGNFCQLVKATLPFLCLFVLWRVAPYARVTRSVRLFSLFFCDHFHCAINSGALSQTDCWFQTLHTSLSPTIHSSNACWSAWSCIQFLILTTTHHESICYRRHSCSPVWLLYTLRGCASG